MFWYFYKVVLYINMPNKEEITYNSKSLVETWLNEKKNITELFVVASNNNTEKIIPCTKDNCGEIISDILFENNEKFILIKLCGKSKNENLIFGELDII